jgi:hypothetical protein
MININALPREVAKGLDRLIEIVGRENLLYEGLSYVRGITRGDFPFYMSDTREAAEKVGYFFTGSDFARALLDGYAAEPTAKEKNEERLTRAISMIQERVDAMQDFRENGPAPVRGRGPSQGELLLEGALIELRKIDLDATDDPEEDESFPVIF